MNYKKRDVLIGCLFGLAPICCILGIQLLSSWGTVVNVMNYLFPQPIMLANDEVVMLCRQFQLNDGEFCVEDKPQLFVAFQRSLIERYPRYETTYDDLVPLLSDFPSDHYGCLIRTPFTVGTDFDNCPPPEACNIEDSAYYTCTFYLTHDIDNLYDALYISVGISIADRSITHVRVHHPDER